jgi:putative nucleotidyltransferase with HDIG domain
VPHPEARLETLVPAPVLRVLDRLHDAGHAGYVVGGSLRDLLRGGEPADWDLATEVLPERLLEIFPGAAYENAFGTVAVREGGLVLEVTPFRTEHEYADFRRPHRVEFGADLGADLARRDFTVNAMAWGRGVGNEPPALVDPFDGRADLDARLLRAVGEPSPRFREDALRMIRAVRLAATLGFTIEPATLDAIRANAPLARHLSGERVRDELQKLLAAPTPSGGLRLAESTGLLAVIAPDLAAQRGIPQNKVPGEDLWDHTLRTVDAVPAPDRLVRLAALVHDIGKPATLADGRFHDHDSVGARLAGAWLRRLRLPTATVDDTVHLVRHHMFESDPSLSDAAVRRFIRRIGPGMVGPLFALRRADDVGSGRDPDEPRFAAFRERVDAELAARPPLDRTALAIDGDDLMLELGLQPGPRLGRVIDGLLEEALNDPSVNDRATLLRLAQGILAGMDEDPGT